MKYGNFPSGGEEFPHCSLDIFCFTFCFVGEEKWKKSFCFDNKLFLFNEERETHEAKRREWMTMKWGKDGR